MEEKLKKKKKKSLVSAFTMAGNAEEGKYLKDIRSKARNQLQIESIQSSYV